MSMAHTKDFVDSELIEELEDRGYTVKYGVRRTFEDWWHFEGSAISPMESHDMEEHSKRVAEIAWKIASV